MRFAVLADTHIGRGIPLAIGEHRRKAFSHALTQAVDHIIESGVTYVFHGGDLFERRTLRPHLVQFVHDELYRLATETKRKHGWSPKIFIVRGNHDGRPGSDTLDYIRHPLAEYLHIFSENESTYSDSFITVVGLNHYDELDRAYEVIARPALMKAQGLKVLLLHGFVQGYNNVPPYSTSVTLDSLAEANPDYVFTGHYHRRCKPRRLPSGGWLITPGSPEMYDFAESPDKGFYIVEHGDKPEFRWVPLEPLHYMKQVDISSDRRRPPSWYSERVAKEVDQFLIILKESGRPGYLRLRLEGGLTEGFPSNIHYSQPDDPLLLWVDVDTMKMELPPLMVRPQRDRLDIKEYFSIFGEFSGDIQEMHRKVGEALEEKASTTTGLLRPSQRLQYITEWVKRFESRTFKEEEG
jgi:DNA repair exonuclease SbcCD nuclease subunit